MINAEATVHYGLQEVAWKQTTQWNASAEVPLEYLKLSPRRRWIDNREMTYNYERGRPIVGGLGGEWEAKFQLRALNDGQNTTLFPPHHLFFQGVNGIVPDSVTGGYRYRNPAFPTPGGVGSRPSSFSLWQIVSQATSGNFLDTPRSDNLAEGAHGCFVERLDINVEGGQPVTCEATGKMADYSFLGGYIFTDGAVTSPILNVNVAPASLPLDRPIAGTANLRNAERGGLRVAFNDFINDRYEDNSGIGFAIDTIVEDVGSNLYNISFSPGGGTGPVASGSQIVPLQPAFVGPTNSHVVDGITCTMDLGPNNWTDVSTAPSPIASAIQVNSVNLSMTSGLSYGALEGSSLLPDRIVFGGLRKLTGRVRLYLETDFVPRLHAALLDGSRHNLVFTVGQNNFKWTVTCLQAHLRDFEAIPLTSGQEGVEVVFSFQSTPLDQEIISAAVTPSYFVEHKSI